MNSLMNELSKIIIFIYCNLSVSHRKDMNLCLLYGVKKGAIILLCLCHTHLLCETICELMAGDVMIKIDILLEHFSDSFVL